MLIQIIQRIKAALMDDEDMPNKLGTEETLEDYDIALSIDPNDTSAYINKGRILMSLGREEEGLEAYYKSLAMDLAKAYGQTF